jgi:hypothetical protein
MQVGNQTITNNGREGCKCFRRPNPNPTFQTLPQKTLNKIPKNPLTSPQKNGIKIWYKKLYMNFGAHVSGARHNHVSKLKLQKESKKGRNACNKECMEDIIHKPGDDLANNPHERPLAARPEAEVIIKANHNKPETQQQPESNFTRGQKAVAKLLDIDLLRL